MTELRLKKLVEQARRGNIKAFEELVAIHLAKLRMFSLSISGGNHDVADEILQESLIKAYLNIKKFENRSEFTTWLWKIVRNELKMYHRNSKTRKMFNLDDVNQTLLSSENSQEQHISEKESSELINSMLSKLSMKLKEAIVLVDIQELSYLEAAEILGISVTALKSRVLKGRRNLIKLAKNVKKK